MTIYTIKYFWDHFKWEYLEDSIGIGKGGIRDDLERQYKLRRVRIKSGQRDNFKGCIAAVLNQYRDTKAKVEVCSWQSTNRMIETMIVSLL